MGDSDGKLRVILNTLSPFVTMIRAIQTRAVEMVDVSTWWA